MNRDSLPSSGSPVIAQQEGFSLVEVVLALAIVSFALIGILSIFPVALDTARDSKTETRVTLIAQSIFSDLQTSPATNAEVVYNEVSSATNNLTIASSLNNFQTVYVAYDQDGQAIKQITPALFAKYTGGDATFLASVSATTNLVTPKGLALVNVSIQAPPAADTAQNTRKKYYFSAYLPIP